MNAHPRPEWGVIEHEHRIVCWFYVDEWTHVTQAGQLGGTMKIPVRTGSKVFEARILGSETLLEISPELRTAIEADRTRAKS